MPIGFKKQTGGGDSAEVHHQLLTPTVTPICAKAQNDR